MFTGLVEECGVCLGLEPIDGGGRLIVQTGAVIEDLRVGDSLAVNGCCLTVASGERGRFAFDLLAETLRKTNLGELKAGDRVNLERALAAQGRLGGHFVQGHIDDTASVRDSTPVANDLHLVFNTPPQLAKYIVYKGSVAINGVSLTVAEESGDTFGIWIIPHTREVTNLGDLQPGDRVNLETDILAKYAEKILGGQR